MDSFVNSNFIKLQVFIFRMNGKTLFVNISNETLEEAKKIKPGSVITVKHSGVNVHGTLLYPQFYRERNDVQWTELNKS